MKPLYWILNGIAVLTTCFAMYVLSFNFSLPSLTAQVKQYADCSMVSDSFLTYLVIAAISSLISLIAIFMKGSKDSGLENSRFAFYSIALTWAPLLLLLLWGGVLFSVGKLYWQFS